MYVRMSHGVALTYLVCVCVCCVCVCMCVQVRKQLKTEFMSLLSEGTKRNSTEVRTLGSVCVCGGTRLLRGTIQRLGQFPCVYPSMRCFDGC